MDVGSYITIWSRWHVYNQIISRKGEKPVRDSMWYEALGGSPHDNQPHINTTQNNRYYLLTFSKAFFFPDSAASS